MYYYYILLIRRLVIDCEIIMLPDMIQEINISLTLLIDLKHRYSVVFSKHFQYNLLMHFTIFKKIMFCTLIFT